MARRRVFRRRRSRLWGWLIRLLLLAALAWLIGFGIFTARVWNAAPPAVIPHADGIVALTGGDDRVSTGLGLLAAKAAPLLLISGAGRGTYLGDFTADDTVAATHFAGAITLGHRAETTRGNAVEAAEWARQHQMHSLVIVTADYHMPRALLVIGQALPNVGLIAYPVRPPAMTHLFAPGTLRLLAGEYTKYLVVWSGIDQKLSAWAGAGFGAWFGGGH